MRATAASNESMRNGSGALAKRHRIMTAQEETERFSPHAQWTNTELSRD